MQKFELIYGWVVSNFGLKCMNWWEEDKHIDWCSGVRIADEVNPIFRGQNQVITCHNHKSWFWFGFVIKRRIRVETQLRPLFEAWNLTCDEVFWISRVYLFRTENIEEYFRNRPTKWGSEMRPSQRLETHLHRTTYMQVSRQRLNHHKVRQILHS